MEHLGYNLDLNQICNETYWSAVTPEQEQELALATGEAVQFDLEPVLPTKSIHKQSKTRLYGSDSVSFYTCSNLSCERFGVIPKGDYKATNCFLCGTDYSCWCIVCSQWVDKDQHYKLISHTKAKTQALRERTAATRSTTYTDALMNNVSCLTCPNKCCDRFLAEILNENTTYCSKCDFATRYYCEECTRFFRSKRQHYFSSDHQRIISELWANARRRLLERNGL